jgi:phage FluMu protein Com
MGDLWDELKCPECKTTSDERLWEYEEYGDEAGIELWGHRCPNCKVLVTDTLEVVDE